MAEVKHGIEKVSRAVILGIETGQLIAANLKDGFQPLPDLLSFLGKGTEIQQMIKADGKAIKDQFLDIDKEEGAALNKIIAEKFKVNGEKADRLAKAGFNLLWSMIFFIDEIKEPGDANTPVA